MVFTYEVVIVAQRLKRWESPRKSGRNDKGKGGSARQRQRKKQFKVLEKRLKQSPPQRDHKPSSTERNTEREGYGSLPFLSLERGDRPLLCFEIDLQKFPDILFISGR